MTRNELFEALLSVGCPVAYIQFAANNPQEPPYTAYGIEGRDGLMADNEHYFLLGKAKQA